MDSPHVIINLTSDMIREKDPCSEGIKIFKREFPDGLVGRWDVTAQLLLLASPVGNHFGWAVAKGVLPMWSMRSANLESADLRLADLRSANLESADLRSADLRSANLRSANLQSANLQSVKGIQLADLTGSHRIITDHAIPGWRVLDGRLERS